jgi:hypothetical protein
MNDFFPTESDWEWLEKYCTKEKGLWVYESGGGYLEHDVGLLLDEDGWVAGAFYGDSDSRDDWEPIVCSETPKRAIAGAIEHEIAVLEGKVVELSDAMMELEMKE